MMAVTVKHPKGISGVLAVEAWEAFSFYGTQSIVLLYLCHSEALGGVGASEDQAVGIVGAYAGGVYLMTVVGAWLADRVFGSDRVIMYGATLILGGYSLLILGSGLLATAVALFLIATGSGGIKTNAAALVGFLYEGEDSRQDAGFTLFYAMTNLGVFAGAVTAGVVQSSFGFHYAFACAGIGMAAGLIQFVVSRNRVAGQRQAPHPISRRGLAVVMAATALAALLLTGVIAVRLVTILNIAEVVVLASVIGATTLFAQMFRGPHVTPVERRRLIAYPAVFLLNVIFWALYQQQYTVITIYADENVDRMVFGFLVPVAWIQALAPLFIFLFAGRVTAFWARLGDRQPSAFVKLALGLALIGAAYFLFIPFVGLAPGTAPFGLLVAVLGVFTVAELLFAPVALSLTTTMGPTGLRTQMIALFFLSVALGTASAGSISEVYSLSNGATWYFMAVGAVGIFSAILVALAARPLREVQREAQQ